VISFRQETETTDVDPEPDDIKDTKGGVPIRLATLFRFLFSE